MTEQSYIELFEAGSIPPEAFHHADHVRLGFCYLTRYSPWEALQRFSTALQRFAQAHGKDNLYHETITCAYLLLIHERMARCTPSQSWETFAAANPDLLSWKESILHHYYTQATLRSDLAKRVFVFPDKAPHSSV
jgi:hypothetical protein